MRYIQVTPGGNLHIKVEGKARTKCGRNYAHLDYLPVSEDEYEAEKGHYYVCYKCLNKKREGPRTIKEAFRPERFLG